MFFSDHVKPYVSFFSELGIGAGLIFAEVKTHFVISKVMFMLNLETIEKNTVSISTIVVSVVVALTALVRLFQALKGKRMTKEERSALEALQSHAKDNIEYLEKLKELKK